MKSHFKLEKSGLLHIAMRINVVCKESREWKRVERRKANYYIHTRVHICMKLLCCSCFSSSLLLPFTIFFSFTDPKMDDAVAADVNAEWPFRTFEKKAIPIVSL